MLIRIFATIGALFLAFASVAQDYDEVTRARNLLVSGAHDAAIAILAPAAEAGDPRAQNLIGAAHEHGLGVAQDGQAAIRFYEASAGQGYPPAIYNLALVYGRGGPAIAPDRARAIAFFEQAIGLDYGAAFGSYAALLLETARDGEDLARAEGLLLRGAERGDPASIEILAYLRRSGQVGERDLAEARRLYEVAALMGSVEAQIAVAAMFAQGEGGRTDFQQAHEYYTYAINAGRADALYSRGLIVMAIPDQFEDGRVWGLAECLAGANLARRRDFAANCEAQAQGYSEEIRRAAEAEVPGLVEAFVTHRE